MPGAGLTFGLAGAGSAYGIAIASHAAAGVMREKPELFGRMLVMIALPGTQGFYGFIAAILIMTQTGLIGGGPLKITLGTGIALFFIGLGDGIAQLVSAIKQGEAAAAGISLIARRPGIGRTRNPFPCICRDIRSCCPSRDHTVHYFPDPAGDRPAGSEIRG